MGDGLPVESGGGVVVEGLHRVAQARRHPGALRGHVRQVAGAGDEGASLTEALLARGELAHPRLRLPVLLHGEVPARHVAAQLLQVRGVTLRGGARRGRLGLRRRRLVGGSDLVRHLHGPGGPHGAAVHEGLPPVPLVRQAGVDTHLAAAAPAAAAAGPVGDLGDGRGVVLRVGRRQSVPRGTAHHSVRLVHQMHLLLLVLIIVIEVGQLGLILIRGGMVEGWL